MPKLSMEFQSCRESCFRRCYPGADGPFEPRCYLRRPKESTSQGQNAAAAVVVWARSMGPEGLDAVAVRAGS